MALGPLSTKALESESELWSWASMRLWTSNHDHWVHGRRRKIFVRHYSQVMGRRQQHPWVAPQPLIGVQGLPQGQAGWMRTKGEATCPPEVDSALTLLRLLLPVQGRECCQLAAREGLGCSRGLVSATAVLVAGVMTVSVEDAAAYPEASSAG